MFYHADVQGRTVVMDQNGGLHALTKGEFQSTANVHTIGEPPAKLGNYDIWLGNHFDAGDDNFLDEANITAIVSVGNFTPVGHRKHSFIPLTNPAKLADLKLAAAAFDVFNCNGERVLIHCLAGVDRSPTVLLVWLVEYEGYTVEDAVKLLKASRPCCNPHVEWLEGWRGPN